MTLNEIKSAVVLNGLTMTKLSRILGVDRRTMYYRIKRGDPDTFKNIKKILNI